MKKTITVFVVVVLLLCISSPIHAHDLNGLGVGQKGINVFYQTGDYAYDIVQYANTQVGNGNIYLPGQAWCAAFVSHCADAVQVPANDIYRSNTCSTIYNYSYGVKHSNPGSYTPMMGDLIFFSDTSSLSNMTHIGIVRSSNSSYVYTIEGNSGGVVSYNTYSRTSSYIVAYLTPNYTGSQHVWTNYSTYRVCSLCGCKEYYPQKSVQPEG